MKSWLNTHKSILMRAAAVLLVVILCVSAMLTRSEAIPENPLADEPELIVEQMELFAGGDDVDEEAPDRSEETDEDESSEEEETSPEESSEESSEEEETSPEEPEENEESSEESGENAESTEDKEGGETDPSRSGDAEGDQNETSAPVTRPYRPTDATGETGEPQSRESTEDPADHPTRTPGPIDPTLPPDDTEGNHEGEETTEDPSSMREDPTGDPGGDHGIADDDKPTGDEGDGDTGKETPDPLDDDPKKPIIVTNLNDYDNPRIITFKQLPDAMLEFYAYIENAEEGMTLQVRLINDETGKRGQYLVGDGEDYEAKLVEGANRITLFMRKSGVTQYNITYTIRYVPDKASEEDPVVGDNPPIITARGTSGTDDFTAPIKTPNYQLQLTVTDGNGNGLPYDNIQVRFIPGVGKSQILGRPTGSRGKYEYDLHFADPVTGDTYQSVVQVTAWDNNGNSVFRSYTLTFEMISEDEIIGTCSVAIDMTTIGFGVDYYGFEYEVKRGTLASEVVLAALDYYGLTADYTGSVRNNFYLRGISGNDLAYGAEIPPTLLHMLEIDGLSPNMPHYTNSLSEYDWTIGSGWLYTIDGVNYPGRGLSGWELDGTETITLRYTLALGKDMGSTSGDKGLLNRYCGSWYNGVYHPNHRFRDGGGAVLSGGGCDEDLVIACWQCAICGKYFMSADHITDPVGGTGWLMDEVEYEQMDGPTVTIPAGGHSWEEIERVEPTDTEDGYILWRCAACGEEKTDVLSATGEPSSEQPSSEEPSSEQPSSEEPTSEEPTSEEPTSEEPTSEEPTSEEPTSEEPTSEEPSSEEPSSEEPSSEEPSSEEPEPSGEGSEGGGE